MNLGRLNTAGKNILIFTLYDFSILKNTCPGSCTYAETKFEKSELEFSSYG